MVQRELGSDLLRTRACMCLEDIGSTVLTALRGTCLEWGSSQAGERLKD